MRSNGKLKLSAVLNQIEDPTLYAFLTEVTAEERAMRIRFLMRQGFATIHGPVSRMTEVVSVSAAPPMKPGAAPRPGGKLAGLGFAESPLQFESTTK